jgi:hypothetical protein
MAICRSFQSSARRGADGDISTADKMAQRAADISAVILHSTG